MSRLWLPVILVAALLHAGAFIAYQSHDWDNPRVFPDQGEYEGLAHALVMTGTFPSVQRTPGYPVFLVGVYTFLGQHRVMVTGVQALLFASVCVFVYLIGLQVTRRPIALAAAALTALYPPFPYWSALVLSEMLTTYLIVVGLVNLLEVATDAAVDESTPLFLILVGSVLGGAALVRPDWALFVPVLVVVLWCCRYLRWRPALTVLAGAALVILPWVGHVYQTSGTVSMSPVGAWKAVWWGYGQAVPSDPLVRLHVDLEPDATESWYRADALRGIRAHPWSYAWGRLGYGTFALWAADIPIRYPAINATPKVVLRAFYAVQAGLLALAALGMWWSRRTLVGLVAITTVLYVELVHLPLHSDIRYSLPAKPLVLLFACVAVAGLWETARAGHLTEK